MKTNYLIICTIAMLFCASIVKAQYVSDWRGKNREGIYFEKDLLQKWPEEGLKLLWHFDELGKGFSSVTTSPDGIFTTGATDSIGSIFCFNFDGTVKWKATYGKEWFTSYPGTRTTPVIVDNKLYISSGKSLAVCLDAKTGKKIWDVDMVKLYGAVFPKFGVAESPLVVDEKVIYTPGNAENNIIALNKNTGELIWTSKANGEVSSYCSPLLVEYKGKRIIVTTTQKSIVGIDLATGKMLWSHSKTNRYGIHPNTAIFRNGFIYVVSGYASGGVMLKLADDCNSVSEVWTNTSLDNQMGGVIVLNNKIYGSGHESEKALQAIDWNTGKMDYSLNSLAKGAIIANEGLLYFYSEKGELALVKPTEKEFEVISKFKITMGSEAHWAHPVISNGVIYVRHGNVLMAYSLK